MNEREDGIMLFIDSVKDKCDERRKLQEAVAFDEFNLFTFLAKKDDEWRKELFHSRVLQSILTALDFQALILQTPRDPPRVRDTKYVRLFMDMIYARNPNITHHEFSGNAVVEKEAGDEAGDESGRIDLFIYDRTHGVIIENKLNNAGDMCDQLPRYMEISKNRNIEVLAVVYIPTTDHEPSFAYSGQYTHLLPEIKEKLVTLPATALAEEFLDKCAAGSKDTEFAHHYIGEYSKLVKHIGGTNVTAEIDLELLKKIFSSKENFFAVKSIVDVWNRRDRLFGESVKDELKHQLKWQDFVGGSAATPVSDGVWLYWSPIGYSVGFCNPDKRHWTQVSKTLGDLLKQSFDDDLDDDEEEGWGIWVGKTLLPTFLEKYDWGGKTPANFIVEKCRSLEEEARILLADKG